MSDVRVNETRLEFPYSRTLGPVMGAFLTALREHRLLGIRAGDGRILFPPVEYDPETGEALGDELTEVGPEATVQAWTWVAEPSPKHPLSKPFAFALVRPDGAGSSMVAAVDAGGPERMQTGMRVRPRFKPEPAGLINDLEAWEPTT